MSQDIYIYNILKYKHSELLGESLNIGVLIYFPVLNRFVFKYSKNLKRVKSIYQNVSEKTILHYLKQIDKKLNLLNHNPELFNQYEIKEDLDAFINKEILPRDASVLQFDRSIKSFQYESDYNIVIEFILKSYFSEISKTVEEVINKQPQLINTFYNSISRKLDVASLIEDNNRFIKNYKVINDTGKAYTFDYAWQNGTLNLVKPLNFDLKTSKGIEDKAHKTLGLFIDLQNEAEDLNLRYDLLVARPSNRDFYKDYDHALKLLELPKRLEIIEEKDISSYSKKAIKALS